MRESEGEPGTLTLSLRLAQPEAPGLLPLKHYRIREERGRFSIISNEVFPSVMAMIQAYSSDSRDSVHLTRPVPWSAAPSCCADQEQQRSASSSSETSASSRAYASLSRNSIKVYLLCLRSSIDCCVTFGVPYRLNAAVHTVRDVVVSQRQDLQTVRRTADTMSRPSQTTLPYGSVPYFCAWEYGYHHMGGLMH